MVGQVKSLAELGLTAKGGRQARVTGLAVDSREVKDGYLFAALPGTSVLFDTGPKAAGYLADLTAVRIEPAGDGPDGFARFRIAL